MMWIRPVGFLVVLVSEIITPLSWVLRVVSSEGPMFTTAHYEASVPENAAVGTPVVRVEAASPSGEPIMYTIVAGNTEEQFGLDYSTGKGMSRTNPSCGCWLIVSRAFPYFSICFVALKVNMIIKIYQHMNCLSTVGFKESAVMVER